VRRQVTYHITTHTFCIPHNQFLHIHIVHTLSEFPYTTVLI
jgi:hypothetical protein